MTTPSAPPALAGPVYWRKNPLLARSMRPLLLMLADGRFTGIGPDGVVRFDGPAQSVTGSLGRMGTLKITVGGTKYALVGRGSVGGTEAGFTDPQRDHFAAFVAKHPVPPQVAPAGVIDATLNASAAAIMRTWRDALAASGAAVS